MGNNVQYVFRYRSLSVLLVNLFNEYHRRQVLFLHETKNELADLPLRNENLCYALALLIRQTPLGGHNAAPQDARVWAEGTDPA